MSRILVLLLALLSVSPGPVFADSDQERAKAALDRGEVRPLDQVLAAARAAVPGDIVKVELKQPKKKKKDKDKDRGWVYELKILTPAGKRRELKIDAVSLAVIEDEEDDDD